MKVCLSALAVALVLTACAAAPSTPTAAVAAPAVPAPAVAAAVPAPAGPPSAPIGPTVAPDEAAALAHSAHELGYTKKMLNGKTVYYCKADATLGTRLSSTKCYTEEQMTGVVQRSIANRQSVAEMEHKSMNQPGGS
jgi:hypothetical protein